MHGLIEDGIYIKKESENGKLKKFKDAWTINLDEIEGKGVEQIVYFTDKYIYRISYEKAFNKGFIKRFMGENKLIITPEHWTITKK